MTAAMFRLDERCCAPTLFAIATTAAVLAGCNSSVSGHPTAAPAVAGSTPASTIAAAQAPGTLLPADLPTVMLSVEDLRNIMKSPSLVKTATWRHLGIGLSITFTPPQCSVVASNGLLAAFDGSGQTGVLDLNYISTAEPLVQVGQGAVTYPDAAAAQALIGAQRPVWQQCANSDVTMKSADDGTASQHNNALQTTADTLTMPIAIGSNYQCVRTLAARSNVVFDNFVCAPALSGEDVTVLGGMVAKLPH
ncbi:sensor domain-containing protein [Mycobacterium sp. CBMA293]|uniref:sensor domain-containing protein n=1 Tax=unclassified Mycolicibacterium TaxID=2636767 RepID=UPI0012DC3698|nr:MULTISPECIES: sensor domain-containing protein [unclassified Mycolicibacterium]MUL49543.1 sensor domain-containing protein [Mycolicibacterium sp. CBMA 360]MUL62128.1 sensor domain-containing protein [Mycolicibacterium sp. CBMA 335]MUL73403.1 sensor domain-containing protein [Mycolicibacterium sp. CBMA 311]MUL96572.1 sensor domain-containing protein [Mycolicibacterium sp. CBMA 230]MUM08537.1 hypothetical protein [Mycolicibacterium sp. CBMA 213]